MGEGHATENGLTHLVDGISSHLAQEALSFVLDAIGPWCSICAPRHGCLHLFQRHVPKDAQGDLLHIGPKDLECVVVAIFVGERTTPVCLQSLGSLITGPIRPSATL